MAPPKVVAAVVVQVNDQGHLNVQANGCDPLGAAELLVKASALMFDEAKKAAAQAIQVAPAALLHKLPN